MSSIILVPHLGAVFEVKNRRECARPHSSPPVCSDSPAPRGAELRGPGKAPVWALNPDARATARQPTLADAPHRGHRRDHGGVANVLPAFVGAHVFAALYGATDVRPPIRATYVGIKSHVDELERRTAHLDGAG